MPNTPEPSSVDLQEVTTRNETARSIITGFSAALPALARFWQQIDAALADMPALAAELTRVRYELTDARRHRANLAAAGLATIAAHHDGEPDPLSYLRDELCAQATKSSGGAHDQAPPDATPRPPDAPLRPPTDGGHQRR